MHSMNEQEDKGSPRISFSVEKVGRYNVGASGITGTTSNATNPTGKVNFEDGAYNASDLLLENIDKISLSIQKNQFENDHNQSQPIPTRVKQALVYDDLNDDWDEESEEEMAKNIDKHFVVNTYTAPLPSQSPYITGNKQVKDNFCRGCGQKFGGTDKFCGRCGSSRCVEASE